jgi:RNA polymerase sigma-70 factor (ECF subfamily)
MTHEAPFRDEMLAALPSLRAFAISLTNDPVRADDLIQDTILRAWANSHRFEPGTNLHAWLFTILRNLFHSEWRRRKREVEDVDGGYAATLTTLPDQEDHLDVEDFRVALAKLRVEQREALLLVAAQGMSYEDVNRAGFTGGCLVWLLRGHWDGLKLPVVAGFGFGRWHIADRFEQAAGVEPVDPFKRGVFNRLA